MPSPPTPPPAQPPPLPDAQQSSPQDLGVPGYDQLLEESDRHWAVSQLRRRIGYGLGLASVLLVVAILGGSLWLLTTEEPTLSGADEHFRIAKLIAHASITVAGIYFAYQLIRAAERLTVPHWWKPDMIRLMLGIEGPLSSRALRLPLKVLKSMGPLLGGRKD